MGAFSETIIGLGHGLAKRAAREQVGTTDCTSIVRDWTLLTACREVSSLERIQHTLTQQILSEYGLFNLVSRIAVLLSLSPAEHRLYCSNYYCHDPSVGHCFRKDQAATRHRRSHWWDYPWTDCHGSHSKCVWASTGLPTPKLIPIADFSKSVFPVESLPYLSLVSTIGLVLFMFVIGKYSIVV
jgi:hypothetical protein